MIQKSGQRQHSAVRHKGFRRRTRLELSGAVKIGTALVGPRAWSAGRSKPNRVAMSRRQPPREHEGQ